MEINSRYLDFFDLDRKLTEDERLIRKSVGEFVKKDVLYRPAGVNLSFIADCWRRGEFPARLKDKMADLGLFKLLLGVNMGLDGKTNKEIENYGGFPEASGLSYGVAMKEIEGGDSGLRSFVSVQSGLVMHAIYSLGSEEQKLKWLPRLASGEIIGCFGATEPGAGSNVAGYTARAFKKDNYYILDGIKEWITNASIADIAIVWVKTEDGILRGFIVEKNTPGFVAKKIEFKNSMRVSDTGLLYLNGCQAPKENILPIYDHKSGGVKSLLQCFNQARFGICWGVIGAAQACFDETHNFIASRDVQNGPLAKKQLIQEKLCIMASEIGDMQLRACEITKLKEEKNLSHAHISMVKWQNCASALRVALIADEILASRSITDEFCIGRHLNNLRSVRTYEGSEDIQKLIVGRSLTDISAM